MKVCLITQTLLLTTLFFATAISSYGQNEYFGQGEDAFGELNFTRAAVYFEKSLLIGEQDKETTLIWLIKSFVSGGEIDEALISVNDYFREFKESPRRGEVLYLLGRIYYLKAEYKKSITRFSEFLRNFESPLYTPNAYYWIGESLFELSLLSEAQQIFYMIVTNYPDHYLYDMANKKLALIELKQIRMMAEETLSNINPSK